ncbi:hypothetical protein [Hydrogenophaga sp.]|uniref:hypothetical protein n=1 Tax=Hydrogenophaga sp. TaxID=1904254 RepID=UPI0027795A51|nr:hypothetical protein [Hydrogenophaga sp.]MDP2418589.1 hypothetical protein [Hydrogenophaga sp.]
MVPANACRNDRQLQVTPHGTPLQEHKPKRTMKFLNHGAWLHSDRETSTPDHKGWFFTDKRSFGKYTPEGLGSAEVPARKVRAKSQRPFLYTKFNL